MAEVASAQDRNALLRLRFGQLRLLVQMSRSGSIRRTAVELNMTQSALSKALKDLESLLGARLYERSAHGVVATAAGRTATRGATLLLAELDMFVRELRGAQAGKPAPLRIGILSYLGGTLLPSVLKCLPQEVQAGQLQLEEGWSGPLLERLGQGELDMLLILCTEEMVGAFDNPSFRYDRLSNEELVFVASPDHPLASRRRVKLSELATERWLVGLKSSLIRQIVEDAFLRLGCRPPSPTIESSVLPNLLEAAAAGLGVAACALRGAQKLIAAGSLVQLNVHPKIPTAALMLVYRHFLEQHPRLVALRDALRLEFTGRRRAVDGRPSTRRVRSPTRARRQM